MIVAVDTFMFWNGLFFWREEPEVEALNLEPSSRDTKREVDYEESTD
jgi:hypothetical protein